LGWSTIMPKCKKCKKELALKGFERYKEEEQVDIYACQTRGCPLKDKNILQTLPTTAKEVS